MARKLADVAQTVADIAAGSHSAADGLERMAAAADKVSQVTAASAVTGNDFGVVDAGGNRQGVIVTPGTGPVLDANGKPFYQTTTTSSSVGTGGSNQGTLAAGVDFWALLQRAAEASGQPMDFTKGWGGIGRGGGEGTGVGGGGGTGSFGGATIPTGTPPPPGTPQALPPGISGGAVNTTSPDVVNKLDELGRKLDRAFSMGTNVRGDR